MGFCFGGGAAIRYSVSNPNLAATVVFYGTPVEDPNRLRNIRGRVLGIFGGADSSIPLTEVNAFEKGLKEAGVQHQITIYDGQPHAFVTSIEEIRKGGAQAKAWNELVTFLNATLKASAPLPYEIIVVHTDMHGEAKITDMLHAVNHLHALLPNN